MKTDTCGCCELPAGTPLIAANRPGLSAIAFRVGTYSSFRSSMLQRIAGKLALSALQTRNDDDYAITVLDMWATVADVLSFYQERIANEGYLRTARLRDSILRMARLLDYQLRPGVAATSLLAFTLDKNASLQIPVGLRAQSVPAQDEKPQVFEALESIAADARLNRVRLLPAPEAFNSLAKGNTSAILAPGDLGLAVAAALSPGDLFLLFEPTTGALEELAVRDLRVEEDRVFLNWTSPIQGSNWSFSSRAYGFGRKFRIFGYNVPSTYMEAVETPANSGDFIWSQRTFTSYAYTPPSANVIELDSKYEDIAVGSRLLISQPGSNDLVTVTAVSQDQATFKAPSSTNSPVQDTVTRLTLSFTPAIGDRRKVVIHEITSPRIRFWGYRYPEALETHTVYIAARRVNAQTAEIGRIVQNNAYKGGSQLPLESIEVGRKVILLDGTEAPVAAAVMTAALIGLDVTVATTPDDLTTAVELMLDSQHAARLTGLRSAALPSSIALTSSQREMNVTIGSLVTRTIRLSSAPATPTAAASQLEAALTASLPPVLEFSQCRVLQAENTLIVFPGLEGLDISFSATANDPTTARELGLTQPDAFRIDTLLSGNLSPFPVLSSSLRQLSVTFGPIGPRVVALSSVPSNLSSARTLLEVALPGADPAPAFTRSLVFAVGSRLLILPGTGGTPIQDYLALTVQPESKFSFSANSAVALGNVALASHGEKVLDEVLGDGDASVPFQKFELQKRSLTYTPSSAPGGVDSTLKLMVNDILWSEVPTLFGKSATDRVYTTRHADDGTVTVQFGDGRTGARLPSGRASVVADYRQGSGLAGRVASGALRTPLDLPVGLKSVNNPSASTGGADPESIEDARENAPTTVRTFGRAVSLRDFEDVARSSGEVAKALATWVWNGETRVVHLTIAAQEGLAFTASDLTRIHASMNAQRDPNHTLFLDNYVQVPIVIRATVRVETDHVASKVSEASGAALLGALSFESQRFGQAIALSEIYAILQGAAGVSSVDIDVFQFKNQAAGFLAARGATTAPLQRSLRIFAARPGPSVTNPVLPAELAVVETPAEDIQITIAGGLPD